MKIRVPYPQFKFKCVISYNHNLSACQKIRMPLPLQTSPYFIDMDIHSFSFSVGSAANSKQLASAIDQRTARPPRNAGVSHFPIKRIDFPCVLGGEHLSSQELCPKGRKSLVTPGGVGGSPDFCWQTTGRCQLQWRDRQFGSLHAQQNQINIRPTFYHVQFHQLFISLGWVTRREEGRMAFLGFALKQVVCGKGQQLIPLPSHNHPAPLICQSNVKGQSGLDNPVRASQQCLGQTALVRTARSLKEHHLGQQPQSFQSHPKTPAHSELALCRK